MLQVKDVNGQWLWLSNGKPGWLEQHKVVPLDRRAIDKLTELINRHPKDACYYGGRADVWEHLGELDIALGDHNEAIRLDPNAAHYYNRGILWRQKGEYDKAIADYNEGLRIDPKNARVCNSIAWIRATCPDAKYRDGQQAVEFATKACELTQFKDSANLDTLAAAYAETGNFDQAVKWQLKAADLVPKEQKADYQTRVDLYRAGKPYQVEAKP